MRIFELDIYKYRDFGKTDVVKKISRRLKQTQAVLRLTIIDVHIIINIMLQ